MILFLALSPSLDLTIEVPNLDRGEIVRPTRVTRVAGGKALNAARAAHALGAPVRAVAALGGSSGSWVAQLLAEEGVGLDRVELAADTRMCSAIVEGAGASRSTDIYEPATPVGADEWRSLRDLVTAVAQRHRPTWCALSGSIPAGVPLDELARLLDGIRASGVRVAVDCSGAGLAATAPYADLLKINLAEASELLGAQQVGAEAACRALNDRFGADAVVTDGDREGVAIVTGSQVPIPPPAQIGVFPAGSGDAFLGGLLTGLDRAEAAVDALELARVATERNAAVPGQGRLGASPEAGGRSAGFRA